MPFALKMALRELRRGRKRFLFFLLSIAIGVAGLVGIKGFNVSLERALLREARSLMAADMQVSMNLPADNAQLALLDSLADHGISVIHITETGSMATPAEQTGVAPLLVEVKAVEEGYPFYGALELNPPGAELTDTTAWVGPELLDRLGMKLGDELRIGTTTFTIAATILQEPDRVGAAFSFGPRVMLTRGGLDEAGLITLGSRATQIYLLKLADDSQVEWVREELRAEFARDRARIADFREAQPQVKRILDRMTSFLSLVSMVALLVGGLGVANATQVFLRQKMDAIAILKCVGATNRRVTAVYLIQMLILSLGGSILGVVLGYIIQLIMPQVVGNILDLPLDMTPSPVVALQGIIVGLLAALLFTLLPLTSIADVKPALVFRRDVAEERRPTRGRLMRQAGLLLVVGLGLGLIAGWMAENMRWGFYFILGLTIAIIVLYAAAAAAVRLTRHIRVPRRLLTVRQGLSNLHRPGSQTGAVVLALGVGVTMVLTIFLLQRSLMAEVEMTTPAGVPNLYIAGLQQGDIDEFTAYIKAAPGVEDAPDPIATVRGRLRTIDGKTKEQLDLTSDGERWFDFNFNLTYSADLLPGNEVVSGRWWTPAEYENQYLISVEADAAERLRLHIGSQIQMELEGGFPVTATVHNIRRTTDFRAGGAFNFVFAPGAFEGVPISYIGQARVAPEFLGPVQRDLVQRFPTLQILDLTTILDTVADILDKVGLVVRFVAGFSAVAGLIILASSIAATKYRRTREAVLFKTLGSTRSRVWRIFAMEYTALGLVSGLVGTILAVAAAYIMLTQVMEMDYRFELLPLLVSIIISVVLTVTVGVISTLDILGAKPLQVLRDE